MRYCIPGTRLPPSRSAFSAAHVVSVIGTEAVAVPTVTASALESVTLSPLSMSSAKTMLLLVILLHGR